MLNTQTRNNSSISVVMVILIVIALGITTTQHLSLQVRRLDWLARLAVRGGNDVVSRPCVTTMQQLDFNFCSYWVERSYRHARISTCLSHYVRPWGKPQELSHFTAFEKPCPIWRRVPLLALRYMHLAKSVLSASCMSPEGPTRTTGGVKITVLHPT